MLAPQWRSTNQFGIADRFNFAGIAGECSVHCQLDEIVAWAHLLALCRVYSAGEVIANRPNGRVLKQGGQLIPVIIRAKRPTIHSHSKRRPKLAAATERLNLLI
ncbi:hypothetical protein ACVWZM_002970 [Bradyrhizobium sp. USDA 4501]